MNILRWHRGIRHHSTELLYKCTQKGENGARDFKTTHTRARAHAHAHAIFLLPVIQVPNEINENPQVEVLDFQKEKEKIIIQKRRMQQEQANNWCI